MGGADSIAVTSAAASAAVAVPAKPSPEPETSITSVVAGGDLAGAGTSVVVEDCEGFNFFQASSIEEINTVQANEEKKTRAEADARVTELELVRTPAATDSGSSSVALYPPAPTSAPLARCCGG